MFIIKDLTEEDIAKMFPSLPAKDREQAAYHFTQYLRVVARIFDRMEQEGKVPKSLYRLAEKRRKRRERRGEL